MKKSLILTGAGISAESGIQTFRDSGGLWANHRVEDVASPQGFQKNPKLVWNFYKERFAETLKVEPNPAHLALSKLEKALQDDFYLITQNVDGLHTRAGNKRIYEMHGRLSSAFCTGCSKRYQVSELDLDSDVPLCSKCGKILRPDVVWFEEIPYYLYEIEALLKSCDIFVILGTSGTVYPAAGFVMTAKLFGAHTIAINLSKPDNLNFIDEFYLGKCGELLPPMVDRILEEL